MSFEEHFVDYVIRMKKEKLEASIARGDVKTLKDLNELNKRLKSEIVAGFENVSRGRFEEKFREYSEMVSGKPPMFGAIFEVAKTDFVFPSREENEKLTSYLSRMQDAFNQLNKEVEVVRSVANKHEKLERLYKRKDEFKELINEGVEASRMKGVRIRLEDLIEDGKIRFRLPTNFSTEIAKEVVKEKLEKGEYEQLEDKTLSPIVSYRGKKINAGRFYPNYASLKERGAPFILKKEDIRANFCDDYDVFVEWLGTLGLRTEKIDSTVYIFAR